jgi:hypothetical protein
MGSESRLGFSSTKRQATGRRRLEGEMRIDWLARDGSGKLELGLAEAVHQRSDARSSFIGNVGNGGGILTGGGSGRLCSNLKLLLCTEGYFSKVGNRLLLHAHHFRQHLNHGTGMRERGGRATTGFILLGMIIVTVGMTGGFAASALITNLRRKREV